jgi:predicted transcriptional regulator
VQLLSAYLANNTIAARDVPDLIRSVRGALVEQKPPVLVKAEAPAVTPAVSVRKSLASSEHILSMIDGKPYRVLRRHVAAHGLTPESYRALFNLPEDYPMVAPGYAASRRALARQIGFGAPNRTPDIRGDEGAAVLAQSAVEPAAAKVRSSKPVEEFPQGEPNPSSQQAEEEGRAKSRSVSAMGPVSLNADSNRTEEPVKKGAMPTRVKAKDPRSDYGAAQMKGSTSRVTEEPRRRTRLSLFTGRSAKTDVQSHQNGTAVATMNPTGIFDLDGGSQASAASAAASGGEVAMALAPGLPTGGDEQDSVVIKGTSPRLTVMEAIARKQAVTAIYNGAVIKLAPHQIFERHEDLFLTALNLSKNWRADEERRLGQFKLAGLKDVKLLEEAIAPLPSYDGTLPRPEDSLILSI